MGTITVGDNFPTSLRTEPGLVEVQGGQLGLFEAGTVATDYGAGNQPLWTLFPNKPSRIHLDATANTTDLSITLPDIDNDDYALAHEGFSVYVYNGGSANDIILKNFAGTAIKTIPISSFAEVCAYTGASNDWVVVNESAGTSVDLQQAYNNSADPEIKLDTTRNGITIFGNDANTVPSLLELRGNDGAGGVAGNYLSVFNTGSGTATSSAITGLGNTSTPTGDNSMSLGLGSTANFVNALAFGENSNAAGNRALAIGTNTQAAEDSVALGGDAGATSGAQATGTTSISIGNNSEASSASATAVGTGAQATTGAGAAAFGTNAAATNTTTVAVGSSAAASSSSAVAVGPSSQATTGAGAAAFGSLAAATATSALAVGASSTASAAEAVALGPSTTSSGANAITVGSNSTSSAANSGALGENITSAQIGTLIISDSTATNNTTDGLTPTNKQIISYANGMQLVGNTTGNTRVLPGSGTASNSPSMRTIQGQALTTDGTTNVTLLTVPTLSNEIISMHGFLIGARTGGAGGAAGDSWYIEFRCKVKNIAGTLTISTVPTDNIKDSNAPSVSVAASGTNALIRVSGQGSRNITWNLTVMLSEIVYA